jgi:hypothetical protein
MLRLVTFLYDAFRFFTLVFLLLPEIRANAEGGFFTFILFCAAPLALFPLMTFFLWLDNQKYKVFAYLYAAGKITGVCAASAGVFLLRGDFTVSMLMLAPKKLFVILAAPCFAFLDILFALPVIVSLKNTNSASKTCRD